MAGSTNSYGGVIDITGVGGGFNTFVNSALGGVNNGGNMNNATTRGFYNATSTVDGIRFIMSAGTISTGVFKLYGIR